LDKKIPLYIKNNAVNLGRIVLGMPRSPIYFLVLFLLMFSNKGFSQRKTLNIWNMNSDSTHSVNKYPGFIFNTGKMLEKNSKNLVLNGFCSPETYKKGIGFFCQKELELDKLTPLPIRFRLGSLEYVNWLERKPNAQKGF